MSLPDNSIGGFKTPVGLSYKGFREASPGTCNGKAKSSGQVEGQSVMGRASLYTQGHARLLHSCAQGPWPISQPAGWQQQATGDFHRPCVHRAGTDTPAEPSLHRSLDNKRQAFKKKVIRIISLDRQSLTLWAQ